MATMITDECINCGACEPECPNTAIYQGGIEYDWQGQKVAALSNEIFYIVPEKCTECVGFYDHEACAAVCPVDCCIPNPNIPESQDVLIARAAAIHPDKDFAGDFPSRFKTANGGNGAAAPAAAANGDAGAAPSAPVAAKPAAAAPAAPAAQVVRIGKVEKKAAAPLQQPPPRTAPYRGELAIDFDEARELVEAPAPRRGLPVVPVAVALLQPLLGALPAKTKDRLEAAFQDRRIFSSAGATGMNICLHLIAIPMLFTAFAVWALNESFYSSAVRPWFLYGMMAAIAEAVFRLRDSVLSARPLSEVVYRGSVYGPLLIPLVAPLLRRSAGRTDESREAFEGYYDTAGSFDEKRERERRYGEVFTIAERPAGYLFRLELPRRIPPSGVKTELGLGDEMPDYALTLTLENASLLVHGKVVDPRLRTVAATAPAFPPDFTTRVPLSERCIGFVQRSENKVLEVVLVKESAAGRLPAHADAA
jgi:ferredoxin